MGPNYGGIPKLHRMMLNSTIINPIKNLYKKCKDFRMGTITSGIPSHHRIDTQKLFILYKSQYINTHNYVWALALVVLQTMTVIGHKESTTLSKTYKNI